MKRILLGFLSFVIFVSYLSTSASPVLAATFNPNNIIDNTVFNRVSSLNAAQIDAFLNTFPNSCISTNKGFSAPDTTGYNPTNGYLYGANVSAGQIIYNAAQAYGINPQVLITTLQKEQSLIDGGAGCSILRYAAAMGYNCPDGAPPEGYSYSEVNLYSINGVAVTAVSGTCVNRSLAVGFSQQVIRAAWVLEFGMQRAEGNIAWAVIKPNWDNSDDLLSGTCYVGAFIQGTWQRCPNGASAPYDGVTTIDSTSVTISNGATASLYNYTPHFPGNQSFFNIFNNYFGSTYGSLVSVMGDGVYKIENGQKRVFPDGITFLSYSYLWSDISLISSTQLSQIPDGIAMPYNVHYRDGKFVKTPDSDGVFLIENGLRRPVSDGITLISHGYSWANVVTISATEMSYVPLGPAVPYYAHFRDGKMVMISTNGVYSVQSGQKRPFPDGATFLSYGYKLSDVVTISATEISYIPLGAYMPMKP